MIKGFAERLAEWQQRHGRHSLPWQQRGPYETWISEIMLQQTQVQVVIPYFNRFVASFPSEEALASAQIDDVLAHWAGLGYYSRARNLHRAAQVIMQEHQGSLPNNLHALIALPGIGRSTSGAILSLGFEARGVIQDGNVRRVLSRLFCISGDLSKSSAQKQLWDLADTLTPDSGAESKVHTQAMMDLGSLICRRSRPGCDACPVADYCQALQSDSIARFPERKKLKQRPEELWVMLQLVNAKGETLFVKRPSPGIWGGLYCPPIGLSLSELAADIVRNEQLETEYVGAISHTFSHFRVRIEHYAASVDEKNVQVGEWCRADRFQKGVPAPINKILIVRKLNDASRFLSEI